MAVVETRYGKVEGVREQGAEMYPVTWESPTLAGALGSCHAIELPFVSGTVDKAGQLVGVGPDAQAFGERIMDIWPAFTGSGDPGWTPDGSARRGRMLLGPECEVAQAPLAAERAAWDGLY